MKKTYHYIVYVTIRDGEFEYSQTSTLERFTKQTEKQIEKFANDYFSFQDSYQEVRVRGYQEISEHDYKILSKYGI